MAYFYEKITIYCKTKEISEKNDILLRLENLLMSGLTENN